MPTRNNFTEDYNQLRKHLPDVGSFWGILRILTLPVLLFLVVSQFFLTLDLTGGFWMLDAEVLVLTFGFLSLYLFFRLKEPLKEKFGQGAYALAFKRFILPGLTLIVIVLVRIRFIGGPMVPAWILHPAGTLLGWLFILAGVTLWLRAVQTLGIDSLTMTYVYFPAEGKRTENAIYMVVRHPVYGAALQIALGLALLNGSWFALTLALIFGLYLWGWVRLVEEKELIERFGSSYSEYRNSTPAFWPRLRDVGRFIRFLLRGS